MSQEWYYAKGDQKHGPITSEQLRTLARSRQLMPSDLVWTEGMADWRQLSSVKSLLPTVPSGLPPLKEATPVKPPVPETVVIDDAVGEFAGSIPQQPWYCHWAVLTLTTLFCFPATWVLVWWKSTYSKPGKWAWTVAACFIAAVYASNNGAKDGVTAVPQASVIKKQETSVSRRSSSELTGRKSDDWNVYEDPFYKELVKQMKNGGYTEAEYRAVRRGIESAHETGNR